ncbi:hypothetical protein QTP70_012398 [Hemibagrus guttatus]|uniref:RING-type E3 ubiquitin transferase n=1 Tax=Hemibagrus guttatus TaxID=175788 RepID=A0AAE0Q6D5_9TELE|nr:hypothetical protein QTP70_012398 [Hemibagrus guttatus]
MMMMMMMMSVGSRCCVSVLSVALVVLCARVSQCGLVHGEQVAFVRVSVQQEPGSSVLQGRVLQGQQQQQQQQQQRSEEEHELQGDLRLVKEEQEGVTSAGHRGEDDGDEDDEGQRSKPWIGVVPVQMEESHVSNSKQESFASTVVNKMKRALVLGASALIILVLNQNTLREMDVSQLLSKPIIIIQNSENVTKLFGALLRGLHATARITYKTFLQNNLKYLQQLWNTVVLIALILSTGVLVHARWQYHDDQLTDQLQVRTQDNTEPTALELTV